MLIVDCNNLLHNVGRGRRAPFNALAALLLTSRHATREIVLVRDGSPYRADHAEILPTNCRVIFSGPGVQADDIIERLLAEAPDASRISVVSSDRRLRNAAAFHHAESIPSRRFAEELARDASKRRSPADSALTRDQVAAWCAEFGIAGGSPVETNSAGADPPNNTPPQVPAPLPLTQADIDAIDTGELLARHEADSASSAAAPLSRRRIVRRRWH